MHSIIFFGFHFVLFIKKQTYIGKLFIISFSLFQFHFFTGVFVGLLIGVKFVLGAPFVIVLLIYKWRRKHLSMYDGVEDFLSSHNSIIPIRHSYKEIKKIKQNNSRQN